MISHESCSITEKIASGEETNTCNLNRVDKKGVPAQKEQAHPFHCILAMIILILYGVGTLKLNIAKRHKVKALTINIAKDFSKYIGGREKKFVQFSGEDFRERFLENNLDKYDKIIIELDGTLGYPWDFLDETFGTMARRYGKEKFWEKFNLISANNYVTEKITYIVDHSEKED